jgi:Protein kinase domain
MRRVPKTSPYFLTNVAQRALTVSPTSTFNVPSAQAVLDAFISVCSLPECYYQNLTTPTVRSKHNLRFYAIKVLQKEKIVKSKQIDHTNNEQQMLLAVQHPFIINLWGSFQDATNLYMVMDFVPGGELFTLLRRSNVGLLFFGCLNHSC